MSAPAHVVLFDGDCAYCNGWVRWITKRDRLKTFRFIALASEEGSALRQRHHVPLDIDSIVLIESGKARVRSDAAWRIMRVLPGWAFTSFLLRIVPGPIRNWGYDLIARNRHRLGGHQHCELP